MSNLINISSTSRNNIDLISPIIRDAINKASSTFIQKYGVSELRKVCTPISSVSLQAEIQKSA